MPERSKVVLIGAGSAVFTRGLLADLIVDGGAWDIALVDIDIHAYNSVDSIESSPDREGRGFRWSVSRRFGGWLPIVTGTRRRGTIR